MKASKTMIGDYDEQSETYAVFLTADEKDVEASPQKEGDDVEILPLDVQMDQPVLVNVNDPKRRVSDRR